MSYFATGNLDHNQESFKRGQEVTGLSDTEAQTLLELGAITEDADAVGGVVSEQLPEVVSHVNPRGEIQPSQVPHPVDAEQARIEADHENQRVAEAEVAAATGSTADQTQPVVATAPQQPVASTVGQPQVVQTVGQPSAEEIAAAVANEGGNQTVVQQSQI